jgi:hypothetical protein
LEQHLQKIQASTESEVALVEGSPRDLLSSPSPQEVAAKLAKGAQPMIVSQSWSAAAPAGGAIAYRVGIYNPDTKARGSLYVYVFVGPANPVPEPGAALANCDSRFPKLTLPPVFGLTLDPGVTKYLDFTLPIPAGAEKSNYLGNAFLLQIQYHDVGSYLDRSAFPFEVK